MRIDYKKYNFCPRCEKKYSKDTKICPECRSQLRTHRRRIISDYLERRKQDDFMLLAEQFLTINPEGKILLSKLKNYMEKFHKE